MKVNEDLAALLFELQRAPSPVERARALARAWRTLRGLSAEERRLLVREVGFDGAEELLEGLAGRKAGSFAPAAVLELLGRARRGESLSIPGLLQELRDPGRREDLLVRGLDLAADVLEPEGAVEAPAAAGPGVDRDGPEAAGVDGEIGDPSDGDSSGETSSPPVPSGTAATVLPPPPPPPRSSMTPEIAPAADTGTTIAMEPPVASGAGKPSAWDELWQSAEPEVDGRIEEAALRISGSPSSSAPPAEAQGSTLRRLQAFRDGIEGLRNAPLIDVARGLETLPEPWARRRALVAIIEAGVLGDASDALDFIAELERPMDRTWCLAALADRGDLPAEALERALAMLSSPAARRRVMRLAGFGP